MDKKQQGNRGNNNNNQKTVKPTAKLTPVSAAVAGVVLDEEVLAKGQDVDPIVATILEVDLPGNVKQELIIEPLEPIAIDQQVRDEVIETPVVELIQPSNEVEELVVEDTHIEEVTMNVVNEVPASAEEVVEAVNAAQPVGMFRRGLSWVANNKLKVVGGVAAVAAVGVGIYYLTRSGKADAAVAVVGMVVESTAEAATEVATA